jgi:bacillithiol biosynthesis cysteine-adding enzyme BshC
MIKEFISLPEGFTNFPPIVNTYLSNPSLLKDFINVSPTVNEIAHLISKKQLSEHSRKTLVEVLNEQYAEVNLSNEEVSKNISLLNKPTTFTITTGHQLCLLSGPLFVIYKILSTIKLCHLLKQTYSQYQFVPIFWLASEDHDFEEINHVYLYNKKISWTDKQGGAVGNYSTTSLKPIIDEIITLLNINPNSSVAKIIYNSYQQPTLSKATRVLLHSLFSDYGLVIIDANNKKLKKLFVPFLINEVSNLVCKHTISETNQTLTQLGYTPTVEPRTINIFYLNDNSRNRIEKQGEHFFIKNIKQPLSLTNLINLIEEHPENFSPNVILRPLYQETILPNLAYIGGPNEIAYWLQLKNTFNYFNIPFPALLIRNSFYLIDHSLLNKFFQLGFSVADISKTTDDLIAHYLQKNQFTPFSINNYKNLFIEPFNSLSEVVSTIDPTLVPLVNAEKKKIINFLTNIEGKLNKTLKAKYDQPINVIKKVKEKFYPNQAPQERFENVFVYLAKDSDKNFLNSLLNHVNPLNPTPTVGVINTNK